MAFFIPEDLPEAYAWLPDSWNTLVDRIAELEAELVTIHALVALQRERTVQAEAEVAALKGRSCETCEFAEGCDIAAAGHDDAAFTYCSVWEEWQLRYAARAEEGSE